MTENTLWDSLFASLYWNKRTLETYTCAKQFLGDWRSGTWKYSDVPDLKKKREDLAELMKICEENFLCKFSALPVVFRSKDEMDIPVVSLKEYHILRFWITNHDIFDFNERDLYTKANCSVLKELLGHWNDDKSEFMDALDIVIPPLEHRILDSPEQLPDGGFVRGC